MSMLEFETQLFLDLHNEDGLVILAKGLGIERLLLSLIKVHNDPGNLVLVLGTTSQEEEFFISRLEVDNANPLPKSITADCSTKDRNDVYLAGGVLFVTSRILVVDMLTERIPINLITGIIVYHAHKTLESCQEAFILRLYRQKNKTGFIKGLSDNAVAFTYGFCQVQRMMRNLFVKKLFLWPRFQADVIASLNKRKPDVVELRVGMTPAMQAIQLAILDIVASCVREIKRVNPSMEMDDLTVENLIARSFEKIIKFQLDPIWHQLGAKTRHLVSDIKTLRTILQYLTQYDCVTFYSLVKSVRDAGTMTSQISDWFFLDAAETLFLQAKARVYGSEQKLHKEEQPGSIAARHGRRIMQGDQILEINGQNVRDSNQKDVAQMILNMDGAIVLLLGRVPSLTSAIQDWARKKAQQSLRTRTSTWSSYTGNNKEKLQIQRPSLPLNNESYVVSFGNCVTSVLVATSTPSGPASRSRDVSPSSSIRRSRLSIVAEDIKPGGGGSSAVRADSVEEQFTAVSPDNPLLPSIKVTSF
ncbi:putative DNA repair endonuclease xp-f / mei-9 / rad1 [Ixodes scapularis]